MSGEKVVRYTGAQMEAMAKKLHYGGTDEFSDEAASMLAQAAQTEADVAGLVKALKAMLGRVENNQCRHEATHRGGAMWTICDDCGEEWADDRGGFKPYIEPDDVRLARTALKLAMRDEG
jgi:hypothetical protein